MTPHKQLFKHDPKNGVYGDCFRTCIACLLDMAPADVPHFMDGMENGDATEVMKIVRPWLAARGFSWIEIPFVGDLEGVLNLIEHLNPGAIFCLGGTSRTGVNHFVICGSGKILHDPSLSDAGIVGPCDDGHFWVSFLGAAQAFDQAARAAA